MSEADKLAAERLIADRLDQVERPYTKIHAVQKARDAYLVTAVLTDPDEETKAVVTRDEIS